MLKLHVMLLVAVIALTFPVWVHSARCVTSCTGAFFNGHYQSCETCSGFVQCGHGRLWQMPCAPGTVWDDDLKTCNFKSLTCPGTDTPTCGSPPTVSNGVFLPKGTEPQSASLKCRPGFKPTYFAITCVDGSWPNIPSDLCLPESPKCGDPPFVPNGVFQPQSGKVQSAVLQCKAGFAPKEDYFTITCDAGSWPGVSSDLCEPVIPKCGDPPFVPNGVFQPQSGEVQSAVLQCKAGFTPKEYYFTITCDAGSWPGVSSDLCEPVIPKCGDPPFVPNGVFQPQSGKVQSAVLQCKAGFAPKEDYFTITCDAGSWPGVSSDLCEPVIPKCGDPPFVPNGVFQPQSGEVQSAVLQCKAGFTPKEYYFTITCDAGSWPGVSSDLCEPVIPKCGDPPFVPNGVFQPQSGKVQSAVLQCKAGFAPKEDYFTITCDAGSWPDVSSDLCEPVIPTCGDPPFVPNGVFQPQSGEVQSAVLQCKAGFTPKEYYFTITCDAGSWPGVSSDLCQRVIPKCGDPPFVPNGVFQPQSGKVQSAVLQCKAGFAPKEDYFTITCDAGSWPDVSSDLCEPVIPTCGDPPFVPNGVFQPQSGEVQSAVLQCKAGFTPKEYYFTITCDAGSWPGVSSDLCQREIPKCGDPPFVPNGEFQPQSGKVQSAVLQCKAGFAPKEDYFTITCDAGSWPDVSSDLCEPDDPPCTGYPEVVNGMLVPEGDPTFLLLECYEGFELTIPDFAITCEGGLWSEVPPDICEPEANPSCGPVPMVANGKYIPDIDHKSAELRCLDEFSPPYPNFNVACINGSWFDVTEGLCAPDKVNPTCGVHPIISNGVFRTESGPDADPNSAELNCATDFTPAVPDYTITCTQGFWSDVPENICVPELISGATGRDFYLAFFENFAARLKGIMTIYMTSSEPGTVIVSSGITQDAEYIVDGLVTTKVHIQPDDFLLKEQERYKVSNKVLRIQSTVDLNVYAYNGQLTTSDATIVFPVSSLGKEYILVAGPEHPSAVVIGTVANTFVNISYPHGTIKYASLNAGEAFYIPGIMSPPDFNLTGTVVASSQPVAVFTGNKCTQVPLGTAACDTLIEQVPCVSSLQRVYVMSYQYPRPAFRVQVVATQDNTVIEIGTKGSTTVSVETKNTREWMVEDFTNYDTIYVKADKPVMVAQYAFGQAFDHVRHGDPSLLIVPGVSQYVTEYTFTSLSDVGLAFKYERVYVIIKKESRSGLRLNGKAFSGKVEVDIHVPLYATYTVAYVNVTKGMEQHLTHKDGVPFGAIQYGAAPFNEYGFALGFKLKSFMP